MYQHFKQFINELNTCMILHCTHIRPAVWENGWFCCGWV